MLVFLCFYPCILMCSSVYLRHVNPVSLLLCASRASCLRCHEKCYVFCCFIFTSNGAHTQPYFPTHHFFCTLRSPTSNCSVSVFSTTCLLHIGLVCAGGDGVSGGRAGQAEGKSSSTMGGTSSRKGLRPQSISAVSTIPSPQQLNQGNTAHAL